MRPLDRFELMPDPKRRKYEKSKPTKLLDLAFNDLVDRLSVVLTPSNLGSCSDDAEGMRVWGLWDVASLTYPCVRARLGS